MRQTVNIDCMKCHYAKSSDFGVSTCVADHSLTPIYQLHVYKLAACACVFTLLCLLQHPLVIWAPSEGQSE